MMKKTNLVNYLQTWDILSFIRAPWQETRFFIQDYLLS